ncbi:MAG: hypothetical protein HYT22_02325 [Candidatus Niyogibacteria bacterium]|nr:hypothetical protein [Candidatus Niyogibacteria bacterium]
MVCSRRSCRVFGLHRQRVFGFKAGKAAGTTSDGIRLSPADYHAKPIYEQVQTLYRFFPELDTNQGFMPYAYKIPEGAEGLFAIPQWQAIAPTYNEAVEKVFAALASQRTFHNWLEGRLSSEYLRRTQRTIDMWEKLEKEQRVHDIVLVPAQFGFRHRGKSVLQARASFAENEFGLGAYEIGIMLLTHPERLQGSSYGDYTLRAESSKYRL